MPWIDKTSKDCMESELNDLSCKLSHKDAGTLTYALYEIPVRLFARERRWSTACILLGAMVGALLCFFFKHVWVYECEKQDENGLTDGDKAVICQRKL